ncbi:hypothetical protein ACIFOC_00430 [Leucobacter aridicollis]
MANKDHELNTGLTPREVEFFEILESLNPSKTLQRDIETTKDELRRESRDKVHRGLVRVVGFTRNSD